MPAGSSPRKADGSNGRSRSPLSLTLASHRTGLFESDPNMVAEREKIVSSSRCNMIYQCKRALRVELRHLTPYNESLPRTEDYHHGEVGKHAATSAHACSRTQTSRSVGACN